MKMTMTDGTVFEGTLKEYAELIAFTETHQAINEAKVEAEYVPQEGDIVVITDHVGSNVVKKGDIGIVREVSVDGTARVNPPNTPNRGNWVFTDKLRKATPAEVDAYEKAVADASKPKLKAGDFVTIESDYYTSDITKGKPYKVLEDKYGLYFKDYAGDVRRGALLEGDYAVVDADEAKWAKIGRKVGEYKVGDIIEITRDQSGDPIGTITKVIRVHGRGTVTYKSVSNGTYLGDFDAIKLVAPVESTLN